MNRLNIHSLLTSLLLITILISCSNKSEMPVWKITKQNAPNSYLVGTIDYLKTEGNEKIITKKVKELFDSSSTYITQIDIMNSDFLLTKNQIEIGMGKNLKDILSEKDFTTLVTLKNEWSKSNNNSIEAPNSVKIKLLFYLQDIIYQNDGKNIFFEQLWLKQAMASKKNITGMETYQKHYQDLSGVTLPEQIDFMNSISNIAEFKKDFSSTIIDYYFDGEYDKIYTEYLEKFTYNKTNYGTLWVEKHRDWSSTIDTSLNKEKCFISLDVKHLYGKENFIDNLLLKGYKVEKIQ